ncbi:hypothetical protein [Alcanivorax sp.]|jgi:hypothetical protein|uniref:hypothetical protein n=1 Tax=Alcanivorax sp. TaxID=1872427 RepID=UPI0025BE9306|nr:hypothetical protein [Alcanivorax sp.]
MSKIEVVEEKTRARLREVFRHWVSAAENYSDSEEFRISINSCIQSVRNVTFVLQSNKSLIDDFEAWYKSWQNSMISDPIMKWCVSARNYIVKQGDLDAESVANVVLLNSHNENKTNVFSVDPRLSGREIAILVKERFLPEELSKYGFLQVERQWVTEDLKGVEVLSALAHAFTVLNLLINDIANKNGPEGVYNSEATTESDFVDALEFISEDDKPFCMVAFEEFRTTNYNLGNGEDVSLTGTCIEIDEEKTPYIRERYGDIKSTVGDMGASLEDRVQFHLKMAKGVLKVDEFHLTTVAIFDSSDKIHMISTAFQNNEDKYLFWKDVAKKVKKLKAKMIITVGDSWRAKLDKSKPLKLGERVADLDDKEEVLLVVGMSRKGDVVTINSPYVREGEEIIFKDDERVDMQPNFLNPVSKAFRKLRGWK